MEATAKAFETVQLVLFVGLGLVAIYRWYRRRGRPDMWIAATFGSLGLVVAAGAILPEDGSGPLFIQQLLIVLIVLFPYFLFRFAATFTGSFRSIEWIAAGLTVITAAAIFPLGRFPVEGEKRSTAFQAWVLLLLGQWIFLTTVTAIRLWRGGREQPNVTRQRMRTLSAGAIAITLALLISGLAPSTSDSGIGHLIVQLFGISSVPLFFLGFSPPGFVLDFWRRKDQERLREATAGLVRAETATDIVAVLLPPVVRVCGGGSAELRDPKGSILGSYGPPLASNQTGNTIAVPMRSGQLTIDVSAYSPYFGRGQESMLHAIAGLTDVALQRVEITERERATAAELASVNEAMRDFVAAASHDLRTPIAVVKGFAGTLLEHWATIDEDSKKEYLATIVRQSNQLSRLVDDMLTASKLDAHALEVAPETIPLADLVHEVVGDLGGDTSVEVQIPDDLSVRADPDHLRRVLRNYLENAFNYGEGPITTAATTEGDFARIVVSDRGAGVDSDLIPGLFSKFSRGAKKGKRQSGTGLGLSIVRGLAKANEGDTWYEPNLPNGSCFGISLPLAQAQAQALAER